MSLYIPSQSGDPPVAFTPLSLLMEASIVIPLRAQLQVVNSAVVNYLLVDAKLNDHFKVSGGSTTEI